jgi:hypothetical protein
VGNTKFQTSYYFPAGQLECLKWLTSEIKDSPSSIQRTNVSQISNFVASTPTIQWKNGTDPAQGSEVFLSTSKPLYSLDLYPIKRNNNILECRLHSICSHPTSYYWPGPSKRIINEVAVPYLLAWTKTRIKPW